MESLINILGKKFTHPRFKEAIIFTHVKQAAEEFFLEHGLRVRVITFDQKDNRLTLTSIHPAQSREILLYHQGLNEYLKEKNLPQIKKITITTKRY